MFSKPVLVTSSQMPHSDSKEFGNLHAVLSPDSLAMDGLRNEKRHFQSIFTSPAVTMYINTLAGRWELCPEQDAGSGEARSNEGTDVSVFLPGAQAVNRLDMRSGAGVAEEVPLSCRFNQVWQDTET